MATPANTKPMPNTEKPIILFFFLFFSAAVLSAGFGAWKARINNIVPIPVVKPEAIKIVCFMLLN